jgi:hypothetical protein
MDAFRTSHFAISIFTFAPGSSRNASATPLELTLIAMLSMQQIFPRRNRKAASRLQHEHIDDGAIQ